MIDIIITCYNNKDIIGKCLGSVKNQSYKKIKCIVVDDCSTDGSVEFIKKNYPWVIVIRKHVNSGPSISRNIGIENSDSPLIITMDSDVELEKKWIEKMVEEINGNVAIVGSKLLYPDRTINSAGGSLTRLGFGFDRGRRSEKIYDKKEKMIYVCSAASMIRRDVLEKIGLFDSAYFYPHEDTDLGWRANIAGYDVLYNPEAEAIHREGQTVKTMSSKVSFNVTKNRIRSMIKNYEAKNVIKYLPVHVFIITVDILVRKNRTGKIKALWWNLINLGSTLKERRIIKKIRKRKDSEIKKLFDNRVIQ